MRKGHRNLATLVISIGLVLMSSVLLAEEAKRPNVLFIAVDDLRPTLGCYGDPVAKTPNIDRLADRGVLFRRAYCQQAVCSPSRLSLMTGRRPDTTRVWDLATHFRKALPDVVTLPQHFKNHGYFTQSLGKIYHGSGKPSKDPPSWSIHPQYDSVRTANVRYALAKNRDGKGLKRAAVESADVPDNTYLDGIVCDAAVRAIGQAQQSKQPFFLAVGFRKPHLPFCAPKKYWELYDRATIPLPVPMVSPKDAPEYATRSWRELEGYTDIPNNGPSAIDKVQELRHGYYACVSYIDALIGRLLNELSERKLVDNTVVVLWGDHGFHLGEQGLWTKANNYELATHVPLIFSVPGQAQRGITSQALVELVDIYPTLADLCGLDEPAGVEGISLRPLLSEPDRVWKRAVFSQHPRDRILNRHRGPGAIMGYAVRTSRYRYVQWQDWESKLVLARELYDHDSDPREARNVVHHLEYEQTVQRLTTILEHGWPSVLPPQTEMTQ
ncbi:MAG: sulfatase [Planctomycetota bacterium]